MTEASWQEVWEIFDQALQVAPEERAELVQERCAGNPRLLEAVEELLAADRVTESFLDQPVASDGRSGSGSRSPAPDAGVLEAGTRLGPYRILKPCGKGGTSTVYLAERADDIFPRRVALKLVRPEMASEAVLHRLETERRILAGLDHPNIARLYDGGSTDEGLPYFVMEFVEGERIDAYCDHNQLTLDERLALFRKLCEPVQVAHQNLVVHRDIKPSNVLVGADGEPKLLDFGIAKLLSPEAAAGDEPTQTLHRMLTPGYASPEQLRGHLVTTASDVYSLGVLLYKLLTDQLPYRLEGRSPEAIEAQQMESEPLPPSAVVERKQLQGDLDAIVLKALRPAPRHRYSSVEQLAADIERYQEGLPVAAHAGDWRYRAGKFLRRHRRAVLGTAAVVLMLLGFAVAMALQAERVTYERDQARLERNKKSQVLSLVLQLFELSSPYVLPGEELTVRQALKRSVPILEDALQDQPEVRAELLHTSGTLLNDLFDHQVAKAQLTEALGILQDQHRDDHPDVVMAMATLASAHRDLLEYEPAEELARAAVASARRLETEGVSQPSEGLLSHALNTLASVLCCRSESPADAELLAREALAVSRDVPGNDGVIEALDRLATMRNNSGDYHEAIELRREVLELLRERFGSDHPRLIATLNNFGLSFRRVESFAESEQAYLEGLRLHRTNFGDKAPSPYLMNNLGALYYAMGDGVRAEKTFREGLAEVQEHFDPWNGFVFSFHLWIERSRILQGKAAEAEAALRQLIPQWKERLNGTLRYWGARGTLGEAVSLQGRCDEAEPHLVESFEALLPGSLMRGKRDALKRLREHFERCDRQERLAAYEAALESSATP